MTAPADPADPAAHRVEQAKAVIEYCYDQGWTDGLPVVPATRPGVEAFLATTTRGADEIIGTAPHLGRSITVAQAAANAIIAGCEPEYFPLVLAAWEAVNLERSARGAWQSTSGPSRSSSSTARYAPAWRSTARAGCSARGSARTRPSRGPSA